MSVKDIIVLEEMLVDNRPLEVSLDLKTRPPLSSNTPNPAVEDGADDKVESAAAEKDTDSILIHCERDDTMIEVEKDEHEGKDDGIIHDAGDTTLIGSANTHLASLVKRETLMRVYRDVCGVADDLQSGPRAREFVSLLENTFRMHTGDEK